MTSAVVEGEGVPKKADKRNEVALILYMTGGIGRGGQKIRKFCRRHIWKPPVPFCFPARSLLTQLVCDFGGAGVDMAASTAGSAGGCSAAARGGNADLAVRLNGE